MSKRDIINNFNNAFNDHLSKYLLIVYGNEEVNNPDNKIVLRIKDKELFFNLLTSYIYKYKKITGNELNASSYDISKYLLLRATTEDFNDICMFLKRELDMINDEMLKRYTEKQDLGNISFLNKKVSAEIVPSETFDENAFEFHFSLHDELSALGYLLPVVRFGIYEKDGKKICTIGSIQNKTEYRDKHIEKKKYKVNDGVQKELCNVEPKKIISFLLFIDLMNLNGIENFEIHGLNVLDYNFHLEIGKSLLESFKETYKDGFKDKYYESSLEELNHYVDREEDIVKFKTEDMYNLVDRLKTHFPSLEVVEYPDEVGSNYRFKIKRINKDDIIGSGAKDIFNTLEECFIPLNYTLDETFEDGKFDIEKLEDLSRHGSTSSDYLLGLLYSNGIDTEKKPWLSNFYYKAGSVSDIRCKLELARKNDSIKEEAYLLLLENEINNMRTIDKKLNIIAILNDYLENGKYTTNEVRRKLTDDEFINKIINKICDNYDLKNRFNKTLKRK